jgi:hypothetical protein
VKSVGDHATRGPAKVVTDLALAWSSIQYA